MNYVFYDFETTGRSSTWDQILQCGAILVNDDFKELDRFEARCSLNQDIIPEPTALLVNKTRPDQLAKTNLSHYGLVNQMQEVFQKWSPAIFIGYNSLSFDEEFLRKTLFKNLRDPYLTQMNGNKRADILGLVRSAHLYYPECIKTPTSEKGNAVFKLDQLAPMNGIEHSNAHDAIGDVWATINIAKLISKKAPSVWKASLMTTSRTEVNQIVESEKLFCFNEYFYGKARPFVVSLICKHPKYNWPQCFDLKNDPSDYVDLPVEALKEEMKKSPKIIRSVKDNKHPIIMNPNYSKNFDTYKNIGCEKLQKRAEIIRNNEEFKKKVSRILLDEAQEKEDMDSQLDVEAEESIYKGGFANDKDKMVMVEFNKAEWKDKLYISDKFKDQRYNYFAKKIIFNEAPNVLPKEIFSEINRKNAKRLLSKNDEKWNTLPKAYNEIDNLRSKYEDENDAERLKLLEELNNFLMQIEKNLSDA